MAKKALSLKSPIKVITSGIVPTTSTLKKGEWAYGLFSGKKRYFGNPEGSAIVEFTPADQVEGVKSVTYNASTAVLAIEYTGETTGTTISLPKENFLSEADYDHETQTLTLTLADKSKVEIDLGELIDVYTAAENAGLEITGNAFGIKTGGVAYSMLAEAVKTKLDAVLSITGGAAETGKYVSAIAVNNHALTVTKASLPEAPESYSLTAAAGQPVSLGGTTVAATAAINAAAAKTGGGLKVTGGALELDEDSIEVEWDVVEI
jgi:hypothetical protein